MRGKNPEHAVFSPDGRWLYVSSEEADSVDIVDLGKGEVIKSVKVGDRPRGIGFLPDSTRAYVAAENADTVNVFDVATHEVIARIKAGSRSNGVTVRPDGKRVYATRAGRHGAVIDTATNICHDSRQQASRNMAITPDRSVRRCGRSNAVAVIDTATMRRSPRSPSDSFLGRSHPLTDVRSSRRTTFRAFLLALALLRSRLRRVRQPRSSSCRE
jgi:YVTN family beta-propeller protein